MTITAQMVMELRKRTGVGMSNCKEALTEAGGDMEEAIHILRKKGIASAVKKGGRETNEGMIGAFENAEKVSLLEVNAETDFVIQNDRFKEFIDQLGVDLLKGNAQDVETFLAQKSSHQASMTIDDFRAETVLSLGENIKIRRLITVKKSKELSIGVYSHMGGKIVSLIVIKGEGDHTSLAKEIAMHVAAEAPEYLKPEDVPAAVLEKEKEIARSQIKNKPAEIVEKIVHGKLNAFYEQSCLLNQKFVKEPSLTIADYVAREGKNLALVQFIRWQVGE